MKDCPNDHLTTIFKYQYKIKQQYKSQPVVLVCLQNNPKWHLYQHYIIHEIVNENKRLLMACLFQH